MKTNNAYEVEPKNRFFLTYVTTDVNYPMSVNTYIFERWETALSKMNSLRNEWISSREVENSNIDTEFINNQTKVCIYHYVLETGEEAYFSIE